MLTHEASDMKNMKLIKCGYVLTDVYPCLPFTLSLNCFADLKTMAL